LLLLDDDLKASYTNAGAPELASWWWISDGPLLLCSACSWPSTASTCSSRQATFELLSSRWPTFWFSFGRSMWLEGLGSRNHRTQAGECSAFARDDSGQELQVLIVYGISAAW